MSLLERTARLPSAGQGRLAAFLLLGFFGVGLPRLFTNAAAFALFLDTFDAHLLPYTYFLAGIAIPIAGVLYLRMARRFTIQALLLGALALNVAVLLALWWGLTTFSSPWMVMTATVWVEVEWVLGNMVYWGLAERVFDVRQAKRHFGVIAAGEPAAAIVGGLSLPLLLGSFAVPDLLLISVVALLLAAVFVRWIGRAHARRLAVQEENDGVMQSLWESSSEPRSRSYLGYVVLLAFVIHVVFFVVDNAFYSLIELGYSDESEVAAFIGLFFAAVGAVTLAANLFAAGPILRRYGLRAGLVVVPVLVFIGCIAALSADLAIGAFALVFWIGCVTKLFHEAAWLGVGWPSFLLLYQPLPGAHRTRAMAFIEGVLEPVASAIAAASLLFVTQVLGWRAMDLFMMASLLMVAWMVLVNPVARRYYSMLSRGLGSRELATVDLVLDDEGSQRVLREGIASGDSNTRLYCVSLLMRQATALATDTVAPLLSDKEPLVRREALRALERAPREELRDALMARVEIERYPPTRAALLRALAASGHPDTLSVLRKEMDAGEKAVQLGAMVGLLKFGGVDGVLAAGERFLSLVRSPWAADRRLAARVLARTDVRAFDTHLLELLRDDNEEVQRDALRAVAKAGAATLLPHVAPLLAGAGLRGSALGALRSAGADAVPVLVEAIACAANDAVRTELLFLLAEMDGNAVMGLIAQNPATISPSALHKVLQRLNHNAYAAAPAGQATLQALIDELGERYLVKQRIRDVVARLPHVSVVVDALDEAIGKDRECALAIAGIALDLPMLRQSWHALAVSGEDAQARAVELIDELAPARMADPITLMLETTDHAACAAETNDEQRDEAMALLRELAVGGNDAATPWIQAAALYTIGREPLDTDVGDVLSALDSGHDIVRETALWTVHRIDPLVSAPMVARFARDGSERVARLAADLQLSLDLRSRGPTP